MPYLISQFTGSELYGAKLIANQSYITAPEHEYIFSKCSRNLNILEIFQACYRIRRIILIKLNKE